MLVLTMLVVNGPNSRCVSSNLMEGLNMESDFRQSAENLQTIRSPAAAFVEGTSPSMRGLVSVMQEVAQSEVPVLLLAEKGAGQKATARRIHELSRRAGQPFMIVACS
jgi:DNA-binding NtrC family response regulator